MTPEEQHLMEELCRPIAVEKDAKLFDELLRELNELLEKNDHRFKPSQRENPS